VTLRRAAALLALLLAVAGCGDEQQESGRAALWITRDRGAHVLVTATVPAGLTAMEALRREADVETRYGGRFVQSIDGIEGSLSRRRDWFYFINGIELDRGAAEYRLHPGDVLWWDYRSWRGELRVPVVVGAFPEPFLHGFDGKRRPAAVRYGGRELARGARAIARLIKAESVAPLPKPVRDEANLFLLVEGLRPRLSAGPRGSAGAGDPVAFTLVGDGERLARNPQLVRFRYAWLP
jgi:Domain of unknown function (DUF4430)